MGVAIAQLLGDAGGEPPEAEPAVRLAGGLLPHPTAMRATDMIGAIACPVR